MKPESPQSNGDFLSLLQDIIYKGGEYTFLGWVEDRI